MPVIPYLPQELQEPEALVQAIRARRGGHLLNLDRLLLHSPPFTEGWGELLGRVRNGLALDANLRELAICTVAACCGADYELHHHRRPFIASGGTAQQFEALCAKGNHALFDARQQQVIRLAQGITGNQPEPTLLQALRADLGESALLELVGVIAAYNMVARFVVALGVEVEGSTDTPEP